jgi:hypothetical protein
MADAMVGTASFGTLIAGTSAMSPDIRAAIANVIAGDPAGHFAAAGSRGYDFVQTFVRMAGDYRAENAPLFGFAILTIFLAFMMFRS